MSIDINKAVNSVPRAEGLKMGEANSVLTTPNPTFGKYSSGYVDGANATNSESIFGKDNKH